MTQIFKNESKSTISIPFDTLSGKKELSKFNQFRLNRKRTYCNISNVVTDYCNAIINKDDDSSLLLAYLKMKIDISTKQVLGNCTRQVTVMETLPELSEPVPVERTEEYIGEVYGPSQFRDELYENIITDELLNYIDEYIEENYDINLDANINNKMQKNDSLMYTDEHCKMLLKISALQKYLIPLVMEYIHQNYSDLIELEYKIDGMLLEIFEPLFSKYFKGGKDIDLLQKLYESVKSRVQATQYSDQVFWKYCEYLGIDWISQTTEFTNKLLTDIVPKFVIEQNVVNLIHVVIKNSLENFFRNNFPTNYKTLDVTKDSDELSSWDKMEISNAKIDESELIINKNNLDFTMKDIVKKYNIKISRTEYDYYLENIKFNSLQKNLLFLFFAKDFNGQKTLYNSSKKEYVLLLIILRRIFEMNNFVYLQELILGNIINKVNEKKTINKKQLLKIIESKKYKFIVEEKFKVINNLLNESKLIEKLIATILNNKFSYVDFNNPELLGEEVKVNQDVLTEEILRYLELI